MQMLLLRKVRDSILTHNPVEPSRMICDPLGRTLPASVHGPDNDFDVLISTYVSVLNLKYRPSDAL